MSATDTKSLIVDYVQYQLSKMSLSWSGHPDMNDDDSPPSKINLTMRVLGEGFKERYTQVFDEMCNQQHITPNNVQSTFVTIVNELFSDGIKWGRIVALFAFSGALAVQCIQKEMPLLVEQDGFVEFYEGSPEWNDDESPWLSFKTLCEYAVGDLVVLNLSVIFAQRSS